MQPFVPVRLDELDTRFVGKGKEVLNDRALLRRLSMLMSCPFSIISFAQQSQDWQNQVQKLRLSVMRVWGVAGRGGCWLGRFSLQKRQGCKVNKPKGNGLIGAPLGEESEACRSTQLSRSN